MKFKTALRRNLSLLLSSTQSWTVKKSPTIWRKKTAQNIFGGENLKRLIQNEVRESWLHKVTQDIIFYYKLIIAKELEMTMFSLDFQTLFYHFLNSFSIFSMRGFLPFSQDYSLEKPSKKHNLKSPRMAEYLQ